MPSPTTSPLPDRDPYPPPPGYVDNPESADEYPSGDDLSDQDLRVLNTDYALQRNLTFYPVRQSSDHRYAPSIPPSLRHTSEYGDDSYVWSEKDRQKTYEGNGDLYVPPRTTSLHEEEMHGDRGRLPYHNARAYQSHRKRRPLIELIRNEWQNNSYTPSSSVPSSPGIYHPNWIQILTAPRFRRYVLAILVILSFTVGNWHYWLGPQWDEYRLLTNSLNERMRSSDGWFGENLRPEFLDLEQTKTLDQRLVPRPGSRNRLIVIGDVHGCHDELISLLAEVNYEAHTDHLIFIGDLIAKGPSSPEVIDLAISAQASCVRGNNEDRVLLSYRDMYSHRMTQEQRTKKKVPSPPAPGMPRGMSQNEEDVPNDVAEQDFTRGSAVDRALAASFSKRQFDYMAACPVILDLGHVEGVGNIHIVHGGLVPGVAFERQDPMGVMHMRTIDLDTHVPSSSPKGMPWYKLWNKYQKLLPSDERSTIIYGHDSRRGLQIQKYSKGLDTGCVRGGRLSALIIDGANTGKEPHVVSVPCKDYREREEEVEVMELE